MAEPTNQELLTHISYIRESVDELKTGMKDVLHTAGDHEIRIVRLEERQPASKSGKIATLGGFLGGLISGFLGSKAAGG